MYGSKLFSRFGVNMQSAIRVRLTREPGKVPEYINQEPETLVARFVPECLHSLWQNEHDCPVWVMCTILSLQIQSVIYSPFALNSVVGHILEFE